MQFNITECLSLMNEAKIPVDQQGKLISIAIARSLGYSLALPSSAVEAPLSHYALQEKTVVDEAISKINESISLDVEKTCSLVQAFWLFRYRLVFDSNNVAVRSFMDGLVKCGSKEFPGYVSEFMIELQEPWILDRITNCIRNGFEAN